MNEESSSFPAIPSLQHHSELDASEVQARYLSMLRHDLRSGLNGAVLLLEVMQAEAAKRPDLQEMAADLGFVRKSVLGVIATTERYRLADRLRRGEVTINCSSIDLNALVAELISLHEAELEAKQLELRLDVPDGSILRSDLKLVSLILQMLLENAVKHTLSGTLTLSVHRHHPRQGAWTIAVADTGPGLSQDRLTRLLDPVRRLEFKERGLGLVIVQYAARLLGGQVDGRSAPGQGLIVELVVPDMETG